MRQEGYARPRSTGMGAGTPAREDQDGRHSRDNRCGPSFLLYRRVPIDYCMHGYGASGPAPRGLACDEAAPG